MNKKYKEFKEFLADECFDLEKYKQGKYDKKIFDWFEPALQVERKVVLEASGGTGGRKTIFSDDSCDTIIVDGEKIEEL